MKRIVGKAVVVPRPNIDTDQIIPARFLRTTVRKGLGAALFADRPELLQGQAGTILVAGENFGCGSSREHAPWALLDAGFRAVISPSIADIFRSNAVKNGLVPVQIAATFAPGTEIAIDLESCTVECEGRSYAFTLDPFARHCLIHEIDELGYLLAAEEEIAAFEAKR
ncbi:MAG: 3-isopropylmalate dehydratase small subunit [Myxococcales bacterium]|nr:3-isopropylmalate dehydratase small subunit [Myxococcales bacterium]